ncbi:hypothetical protein GCM10009602_37690 [Nocardiopsis tropica]
MFVTGHDTTGPAGAVNPFSDGNPDHGAARTHVYGSTDRVAGTPSACARPGAGNKGGAQPWSNDVTTPAWTGCASSTATTGWRW